MTDELPVELKAYDALAVTNVVQAAREWSNARTDVLKRQGSVDPALYDRLAKAETELQKAAKAL